MWGVEISAHLDALERDGALLADAAEAAGLRAAVPGCPGWQVRDLVRHQAYVHDWAARHVRDRSPELIDDGITESGILDRGPADDGLIAAYRAGHAALVATLRDADPDVDCATFMPAPSPLAFWARRQAHETAIHRYDAQAAAAAGPPPPSVAFDPALAADGIDELIMGFAARPRYRPRAASTGGSLTIRAHDATRAWHLRLPTPTPIPSPTAPASLTAPSSPSSPSSPTDTARPTDTSRPVSPTDTAGASAPAVSRLDGRDDPPADCTLEGPAAGLYAFLWNRSDAARSGLTITGRPEILAAWTTSVRVRW
jgi:uncharacterized protein (TIGR03083 family)